ncbi:MAG: shikimate kinase [Anaerovoracaceae bacterium]|nr:shikimate kinase [Bacillota bacterium]MDY5975288.1 shikimate kinase [Anaerovoracaceae bacterium]
MKKNIVLIGMPASGKSTAGVILAKEMKYNFYDTDLLLQAETDMTLAEIIRERGLDGFLKLEDRLLSEINVTGCVIATGGSAVYGDNAMANLKKIGKVVYIKLRFEVIESRLKNIETRGVAMREGTTLRELYDERIGLYEKYADTVIEADGLNTEQTVQRIKESLAK